MFFTLITSELDLASKTMLAYLQEYKKFNKLKDFYFTSSLYDNISISVSKNQLIFIDCFDDLYKKTDVLIFLSRHQSKSKIPSLTCHFPGNYFTNSYGGNKSELGIAYPSLQKNYLKKIYQSREKVQFCDITIETTHHGPTNIKKPVMFVEIGSSEDQWSNMDIASVVCDSLLDILTKKIVNAKYIGIGLGGNHYGSKFNKLILNTDYGIGHIANKYNLVNLNNDMLNQMISKCYEKVTHIIIDQKGLGNEKQRIMSLLNNIELEVIKI
ncbi:MAG TPA: D-aminoacyl-tRNA deacylase [Nitrososphaeraceae archaeon]|nr:D-aminoacyl-tRNA deacylase [Nitrososphaeraceae archaeon]